MGSWEGKSKRHFTREPSLAGGWADQSFFAQGRDGGEEEMERKGIDQETRRVSMAGMGAEPGACSFVSREGEDVPDSVYTRAMQDHGKSSL